jgi:tetratricopeptide (TPR) repeat protein
MSATKQLWFLQRTNARFLGTAIPFIAAGVMLCSSFLPWLRDPLGEGMNSAWSLPIDIGWQFHVGVVSYGLLCLCCAAYVCLVACAIWRPFKRSDYFLHRYVTAGLVCLVPVLLLLLQYLCMDMRDIDLLAQHKMQALLISDHFGYGTVRDLVTIQPFTLDISTTTGRLTLLVDQAGPGLVLPLISAWILIEYRRLFVPPPHQAIARMPRSRYVYMAVGIVFVLLLRSPAGLVCEYEGKTLNSSGNYAQALAWLDVARVLNPSLDQVAYYHEERGQALYYLHPDQLVDDSRAYLADFYRNQLDYLDAYQQLLSVWQAEPHTPWIVSEMSITLEGRAEFIHPLRGPLIRRPLNDDTALPWLQSLIQVDTSNVYGHYVAGRINCDLHDYTQCMVEMATVLRQSSVADIQSSAYTYMGLSEIGLGNEAKGRELLFTATELDPNYRNNVAREELSGLR